MIEFRIEHSLKNMKYQYSHRQGRKFGNKLLLTAHCLLPIF